MFEYRMLQIPPRIEVKLKDAKGNEAAYYLSTIVNQEAQQGWEFFRVDSLGVKMKPGCLAGIFGAGETDRMYYVVTFRRQIGAAEMRTDTSPAMTTAPAAPPPLP